MLFVHRCLEIYQQVNTDLLRVTLEWTSVSKEPPFYTWLHQRRHVNQYFLVTAHFLWTPVIKRSQQTVRGQTVGRVNDGLSGKSMPCHFNEIREDDTVFPVSWWIFIFMSKQQLLLFISNVFGFKISLNRRLLNLCLPVSLQRPLRGSRAPTPRPPWKVNERKTFSLISRASIKREQCLNMYIRCSLHEKWKKTHFPPEERIRRRIYSVRLRSLCNLRFSIINHH